MSQLPKTRQTLLFSATMPEEIKRLATKYQKTPVHVKTHTHVEEHLLPQYFYRTNQHDKFSLLVHLLKKENPTLAIIFCKTKHNSRSLAKNLQGITPKTEAMHGNLSQAQRDIVIRDFKAGNIRFLVATDIAARGLDVKQVSHVFNYNVPDVPDDYVHRIGRTARAGASGKAITLIEPADYSAWKAILKADAFEHVEFQKPVHSHSERRQSFHSTSSHSSHRRGGSPRQHFGGRSQELPEGASEGKWATNPRPDRYQGGRNQGGPRQRGSSHGRFSR